MKRSELIEHIRTKRSFLCVGLDTDPAKVPAHLRDAEDPLFEFNKAIVEATSEFAVAYKINTAFYEALGWKGWQSMERIIRSLPKDVLVIADAKRGDIGNTSNMYAKAFFETLDVDAVTLAPYMGKDSLQPFFTYAGKWGIVLALTSNEGSRDYEQQKVGDAFLYELVIRETQQIGTPDNLMFVVGATKGEDFQVIRKHAPDHFLLVPGVGAQGGSLEEVVKYGMNKDVGLLVNASRSIIYAGNGVDFAEQAAAEAAKLAKEMAAFL